MTSEDVKITSTLASLVPDYGPVKNSPLFKLPLELRRAIYLEVCGGSDAAFNRFWQPYEKMKDPQYPGNCNFKIDMLLTCKAVFFEAHDIVGDNSVYQLLLRQSYQPLWHQLLLHQPLSSIQRKSFAKLRHYDITIEEASSLRDRLNELDEIEEAETLHVRFRGGDSAAVNATMLEMVSTLCFFRQTSYLATLAGKTLKWQAIAFSTDHGNGPLPEPASLYCGHGDLKSLASYAARAFEGSEGPKWHRHKIDGDCTKRFILWRKGLGEHSFDSVPGAGTRA